MNSNLTSLEKECGNCKHWEKNVLNTPGRDKGECAKGQGQRYCTDYCWRWEVTNGLIQVTGRTGDSRSAEGRPVARTTSNN